MKIIPKEEIDRENTLRFDLLEKKTAFAQLVFQRSKTQADFIGTAEQINNLPEGEIKEALISGYSNCVTAAMKISAEDQWFEDIQRIIEQIKETEENQTEETK